MCERCSGSTRSTCAYGLPVDPDSHTRGDRDAVKRLKQPNVLEELHQIREDMAREAHKVGVAKYYLAMNKRSKWLLGTEHKPQARNARDPLVVRERSRKKYGTH
jgi:hypothetical protein